MSPHTRRGTASTTGEALPNNDQVAAPSPHPATLGALAPWVWHGPPGPPWPAKLAAALHNTAWHGAPQLSDVLEHGSMRADGTEPNQMQILWTFLGALILAAPPSHTHHHQNPAPSLTKGTKPSSLHAFVAGHTCRPAGLTLPGPGRSALHHRPRPKPEPDALARCGMQHAAVRTGRAPARFLHHREAATRTDQGSSLGSSAVH